MPTLDSNQEKLVYQELDSLGSELLFVREFIGQSDASLLFVSLKESILWSRRKIQIFGKQYWQPRLLAWYGDPHCSYRYSGQRYTPHPWTPTLLQVKQEIERFLNHSFNSVLCNYYRDGGDAMGFHRDNESELGATPCIASLSLGGTRKFVLKSRSGSEKQVFYLSSGDLLVMRGATQTYWNHGVPRTAKKVGPRINLTFREIHGENPLDGKGYFFPSD